MGLRVCSDTREKNTIAMLVLNSPCMNSYRLQRDLLNKKRLSNLSRWWKLIRFLSSFFFSSFYSLAYNMYSERASCIVCCSWWEYYKHILRLMTCYICALPHNEHYGFAFVESITCTYANTHWRMPRQGSFLLRLITLMMWCLVLCVSSFYLIHRRIKSFDYLNVSTHFIVLFSLSFFLFCIIANLHVHWALSREMLFTIRMNA